MRRWHWRAGRQRIIEPDLPLVVAECADDGSRSRFRRGELRNERLRPSGSLILIPETKPDQLSSHTLLAAQQFYGEGSDAVRSQALSVQNRCQLVSGYFGRRSRDLHDSRSHMPPESADTAEKGVPRPASAVSDVNAAHFDESGLAGQDAQGFRAPVVNHEEERLDGRARICHMGRRR